MFHLPNCNGSVDTIDEWLPIAKEAPPGEVIASQDQLDVVYGDRECQRGLTGL